MSALNQRHIRWLHTEIDLWITDGLVTPEQAAALRGRYPSAAPEIPWGKIIFSGIGSILLGLGVILLFAYNWDGMHRFLKLGVILTFPGAENLIGLDTYDEMAMLCFFLSFTVAAFLVGRWLYTLLQKERGQEPKSGSLREWLSAIGVCAGLATLFLRITVMRNIDDWGGAAFFNLIFLYHAMALIAIGSRTVSMRRTAAGCLLLSLLVIARYVDLFDSLLVRGIIFFLTGGAIFGAGSKERRSSKDTGGAIWAWAFG